MLPCTIDIAYGQNGVALPNSASVIWQITAGSIKPIALRRLQFTTNALGSSQANFPLQLVTYATGTSTNGHALTVKPKSRGLTVTIASTAYGNTATMGTTPSVLYTWMWNDVNPYDLLEGHPDLQDEFPAAIVLAMIQPTSSPGSGIVYSGSVDYVEYG
jgi:hypothetical protein